MGRKLLRGVRTAAFVVAMDRFLIHVMPRLLVRGVSRLPVKNIDIDEPDEYHRPQR